ncbi:MAG: flavin reductase family protein [Clostridiales bacterium]|jgi:flavin reductase (DIM6/NTAB) family NADH-FMN oxidoreductase RutF|nr:flavin reductase family protein [Clostridiales bacterium]
MKKSIMAQALIFPTPVFVLGTYDKGGKPNAATFAWGGIASSKPASVSVAVRPSRYTYEALLERKSFTVNLPTYKHVDEADYFGMVSGRNADKFAATGLTPVKSEFVDAPYIEEFPYALECAVTHTIDLGVHILFIGEVKNVIVDESIDSSGNFISDLGILTFDSSSRQYRVPGNVAAAAFECGRRFIK